MFYSPDIAETHILSEEESQHAIRVLRMKAGDEIDVTDGLGNLYHCRISAPSQHRCGVEILSQATPAPTHEGWVHIAIAPTKNMDRIEWFIEKTTEMGVDEITLLLCEHSERKSVNMERLEKIIVAAGKQSLRTRYPILNAMTPVASLPCNPDGLRLIAHCEGGYAANSDKFALKNCVQRGKNTLILIGPEGDFSPREIQWALDHDFRPISLGPSRLRTETAGMVACLTALLVNQ